jgi:hypothetical protein
MCSLLDPDQAPRPPLGLRHGSAGQLPVTLRAGRPRAGTRRRRQRPQGRRNHTLYQAGIRLYSLVAGGVLGRAEVEAGLLGAAEASRLLGQVAGRLAAERPVGIAELVAVAITVQPGRGLPPGPPPPAGVWYLAEEAGQPGWRVELQRSAGGPGAPAELGDHRPVRVGARPMTFQEPGVLLLVSAQVDQLGGYVLSRGRDRLCAGMACG